VTPDERAAAVCERMASGPLVLDEDFGAFVRRNVADAIREAVVAEREACVKIVDELRYHDEVIVAIRARGNQ
jgi:hypothetical protein